MATEAETTEEIASIINTVTFDELALGNWIGAMRSGDYKFGYGLMRSDEDEYDAFGVLAAISVVTWTWDEAEGAWAVDGEVFTPTAVMVAGWLGVVWNKDTIASVKPFITRLIERINDVGDAAGSFEPLAKLLTEARDTAASRKNRLATARDRVRRHGTISEYSSTHDSVADRRPFFARY